LCINSVPSGQYSGDESIAPELRMPKQSINRLLKHFRQSVEMIDADIGVADELIQLCSSLRSACGLRYQSPEL
jgi:hypothetical protein